MPRSVAEIQAEIAKVKQEIATRDMYRQPQSRVGWASYVGTGDRGLLDAYQNREDQYNKMMKQQQFQAAERALQQKFQEAEAVRTRKFQEQENERNRENARILAREQRRENSLYQMDENMKSRANAATKQQYAQYDLNQAEKSGVKADIERAKMNLALANNELEYWNKRVGYVEDTKKEDKKEEPAKKSESSDDKSRDESKSVPVKLTDSKVKKRFKTRDERANHVKSLEAMDPEGQSKEIQEEINRIKGLDTDEDKAVRKEKWKAGKKKKGFEFRKWKESQEGKKLIAEFGD